MTQYGTIITNIGLAQIANAQVTQQKVGLQYIALGDGNGSYYAPNANQTTLVNEVWRGPVSNVTIDPANDNRIIIEGLIPPTAGGFTIREIAVFDDQNQLIAVGQYPEKYKPQLSEGVSEETLIHFVIETNNVDAVELAIDPTIIIASRQYVDEKVAEHKEQITAAVQDLEDLVESIVQTGVAKLVRYSYTIPATTDGQTEIEIPLTTFDQDTDTVLLIRDSIVLYETVDYTISTRKIVLNTPIGIAANTSFYLLILKNVPSGEEGGVSGGVITDGSIAKRKLEQTLQDEIDGKASGADLAAHLDKMASTSQAGHVQLNDNTNSTSITQAATANVVKKTYDALTTHGNDTSKHLVAGDKSKIDGALQRAGGAAMTGDLVIQKSISNIYMRTENNQYETVLRNNANNTNDVGFDLIRNGVAALHINASNITYVRGHNGVFFSLADLKNIMYWGNGSPEGLVTAIPGALFSSIDGGRLYVKQSGSGNTGWVMK